MSNNIVKRNFVYIAYDGKQFKNMKEGIEYDLTAARCIANDLWFVKVKKSVEGFNNIEIKDYLNCIESFNHTQDISRMIEFFIDSPIVYCHTDKAAKVFTGLMRNPSLPKLGIKGLEKGLNYWFDGVDMYLHEKDFIKNYNTTARNTFFAFKNILLSFIKENI